MHMFACAGAKKSLCPTPSMLVAMADVGSGIEGVFNAKQALHCSHRGSAADRAPVMEMENQASS